MNEMTKLTTAKDWASDQEVRWCPGARLCGSKAASAPFPGPPPRQKTCSFRHRLSSRFPYTCDLCFHHPRRAPCFATASSSPSELTVDHTRDGYCFAICGNHTLHVPRRNPIARSLCSKRYLRTAKGQYRPVAHRHASPRPVRIGRADAPCMFALLGPRLLRAHRVHKACPTCSGGARSPRASFVRNLQNASSIMTTCSLVTARYSPRRQLWLHAGEKAVRGALGHCARLRARAQGVGARIPRVVPTEESRFAAMRIECRSRFPRALGVISNPARPLKAGLRANCGSRRQ